MDNRKNKQIKKDRISNPSLILNGASNDNLEKHKDRTVGDDILDNLENLEDDLIKSGELFKIDIYDLVRLMDKKSILLLFEKLDQLSLYDLVIDYHLDFHLVDKWFRRYKQYHILFNQSNRQLTYISTMAQQITLFYYLKKLKVIDLEKILSDENKKATVLSLLMNRDYSNVRKAMRDVNIKLNEKKYFSKANLQHILKLSQEIGWEDLKKLVELDFNRLYKL